MFIGEIMSISKKKALSKLEKVKFKIMDSSVMSAEERNAAFDDLYVVEYYIREREKTNEETCFYFGFSNREIAEIACYIALGALAFSLIVFGVFG